MKKFVFKLQKVLDLREFEKKQAQIELGKATAQVNRIQEKLNAVASQKVNLANQMKEAVGLKNYYACQQYTIFLDKKKEEFLEEMAKAELVLEEKRKIFLEASTNVKVMEKLKEKKLSDWKKEKSKEEEKEVEELVAAKFGQRSFEE